MYVYLISTIEEFPKYKIGRSKDPNSRIKQLQTANDSELTIVHTFRSKYPSVMESSLHKHYNSQNSMNEWFCLSQRDVSEFLGVCSEIEKRFLVLETNPFWLKQFGDKSISTI